MVILKLPDEIEKLRTSNRIVAEILAELRERVKPGVTTRELDALSEELVAEEPGRSGIQGVPRVIPLLSAHR